MTPVLRLLFLGAGPVTAAVRRVPQTVVSPRHCFERLGSQEGGRHRPVEGASCKP